MRARIPDKVARLVLDSPLPLGIAAEAATEQRVKGQQAALDAFAAQCAATNCPLGPRPQGRRRRAAAPTRGQATDPADASVATVADAITTALAYPRGDRVAATNSLATAMADGPLRRREPDEQPHQPGRHAAPDRRPVRQLAAATR